MDSENTSYFLVGLFTGVCLGGVAALLLAPESGRQLRRDIRKGGRRVARRASETIEDLRDRGEDALEDARDKFEEAAGEAKSRLQRR